MQSTELPPENVPENAAQPVEAHHEGEEPFEMPRGAIAFIVLLLVGYGVYWLMIYSQILAHGR